MAALEQWPKEGVPENPGAWLMGTAKHKALDRLRRAKTLERKQEEIAHELETSEEPDLAAQADDDIGDELLSLIFTACHPLLSDGGPDRSDPAADRGVDHGGDRPRFPGERGDGGAADRTGEEDAGSGAGADRGPGEDERAERLESVLEVVYAIFNEGYAATAGDDWMRGELMEDALRLGRILAGLAPHEPRCSACWR